MCALAGLASTKRGRRLGILIGMAMGGAMGIYQMLKGAHYLSHTLITSLVCWILFLFWRRLLKVTSPPINTPPNRKPAVYSK